MMRFLFLALALFSTPATACSLMSVDEWTAMMTAEGDKIIGGAVYSGVETDATLIIEYHGMIVMAGFKGGCVVTTPRPIDTIVDPVAPGPIVPLPQGGTAPSFVPWGRLG